jgi:hypothetical protein
VRPGVPAEAIYSFLLLLAELFLRDAAASRRGKGESMAAGNKAKAPAGRGTGADLHDYLMGMLQQLDEGTLDPKDANARSTSQTRSTVTRSRPTMAIFATLYPDWARRLTIDCASP